jgi:hypothetical protein
VDGVDMGSIIDHQYSYTFKNVLEPHTIDATFKIGGQYHINLNDVNGDIVDELFFEKLEEASTSDSVIIIVSSSDVVSNISVNTPPKFEISLNGTKWYDAFSISRTQLPAKIYIHFKPPSGSWAPANGKMTFKATQAYNEIELHGIILGINDLENSQNITIHPNPTTGELRVVSSEYRVLSIEVFDIYGKLLKSKIVDLKPEIVMDISHLSSGIYILAIQTPTGVFYEKITKQ